MNDWPSQSQDINIIENLWHLLKVKLSKDQPQNKTELKSSIIKNWYSINRETITKLYKSIPNRLINVIKSKGAPTKY